MSISLGSALQQLREDQGLSRKQLAEAVEISVEYLGKIERGVRQPQPPVKKKILDVLGVGPDRLRTLMSFGEEDAKTKPIGKGSRGRPRRFQLGKTGEEILLKYKGPWDSVHVIDMTADEALQLGIELVVMADSILHKEREKRAALETEEKESGPTV